MCHRLVTPDLACLEEIDGQETRRKHLKSTVGAASKTHSHRALAPQTPEESPVKTSVVFSGFHLWHLYLLEENQQHLVYKPPVLQSTCGFFPVHPEVHLHKCQEKGRVATVVSWEPPRPFACEALVCSF